PRVAAEPQPDRTLKRCRSGFPRPFRPRAQDDVGRAPGVAPRAGLRRPFRPQGVYAAIEGRRSGRLPGGERQPLLLLEELQERLLGLLLTLEELTVQGRGLLGQALQGEEVLLDGLEGEGQAVLSRDARHHRWAGRRRFASPRRLGWLRRRWGNLSIGVFR